jgi:hypothetical protein
MNRLFWKPRQDTLEEIVSKFQPKNKLKKKVSTQNVKASMAMANMSPVSSKRNLPTLDAMVTFITGETSYNPINSMVFLVASNIAYEEFDVIKESSTQLLGFLPDKVAVVRERDNLFYVASDAEKVFIVFRGMTDLEKEKKSLSTAKKSKLYLKKQDLTIPGDIFSSYCKFVTNVYDKIELILGRWFHKGMNQQIYLTGHDTGGALAILVAYILSFTFKEIGAVYAFGSPKVGDPIWGKSYPEWLAQKTYRVSHENDFVACLPAGGKQWVHVGQSHPPKISQNPTLEPHSVESYFKSLLPAHQTALGPSLDRISIRSQNILQGINKRETVRLVDYQFDDAIAEDPVDQNARYQLPQTSNIVRARDAKSPGAGRYRQPRPLLRSSEPLIAPDLLQQIRNNIYILIANAKSINAIIFSSETGDLNGLLATVMTPMRNLMIITGVIASQNDIVLELVRSINHFLEVSDIFYQYAGDVSVTLDRVEKAYVEIMPAAKTVVSNCERVSGRS